MRYFIENRISAWMLFSGLCLFGVIGMTRLPVSLMPSEVFPAVTVLIEYPGISPDRIDALVTRPVERMLRSVPGIQEINSVSEEGKSRIQLAFAMETDERIDALRVRDKIDLIREELPRAIQEPVVMRDDPGDRPALILSVEKTPLDGDSIDSIREFAERSIRPALQKINGVARVEIAGGSQREIQIRVDRSRFDARAVTFDDIFSCINGGNVFRPAGGIRHAGKEHRVVASWKFSSIEEINDARVYEAPGASMIRLSDIASVGARARERDEFSRLNGNERVMLYLFASGNTNILNVSDNVKKALAGMKNVLTSTVYDQGDSVRASIRNVVTSGIYGMIIIILLVYLFYRSILPVAVISLSIPVSLIIVFAFMYFAGFPVDIMSGTGLALAAGMVVDNSVLVTETIFGGKRFDPRIIPKAVRSLLPAMFGSTATTCVVFLPIVFSDIMMRRMYGGMAFTITTALGASLLIAVVLVPSLYAEAYDRGLIGMEMRAPKTGRSQTFIQSLSKLMLSIERKAGKWYERTLVRSLENSRTAIYFIILFALLSALSFAMLKSDLIDPTGSSALYAYIEFPTGTSIQAANGPVMEAERYLYDAGIADKISSKVEKSRGTLAIHLKNPGLSFEQRLALKKRIRDDLNRILRPHDGFAFIVEAEDDSSRELDIYFLGDDDIRLRTIARSSARAIQSIPGIDECILRFREGTPSCHLYIDRNKSAHHGVTQKDIAYLLHNALHGPVAAKFFTGDREMDIRCRFEESDRDSIDDILNAVTPAASGRPIAIRELVRVEEREDPVKLWRSGGRKSVSITARIGSIGFDEAIDKINTAIKGINMPQGYTHRFSSDHERGRQNRRNLVFLAILSAAMVFLLVSGIFESLGVSLIIMASVPFAFMGVFIMLFITSTRLSMPVYLGLIFLAGIVVNNAIVIITTIRHEVKKGKSSDTSHAIISRACLSDFRPIMITTISTIAGFIPSLIQGGEGSALWRPLAITVISGLLSSTFLTMFVIPVVCDRFLVSPALSKLHEATQP